MFSGLIFARDEAADLPGALVATLPFAGATLLETQARRLSEAGASRIFVVAGRITPALTAAIDRLAARQIATDLIRKPAELGERLRPGQPVMLIADGVVADGAVLRTIAHENAPLLLAVADAPGGTALERIDPRDHWAGVALIDAAMLEQTVATLGDWDLQSTLLRKAAQAGAIRRYLSPDAAASDHALIVTRADAERVDAQRLATLADGEGQVAQRVVTGWIARPLIGVMDRRAVPPWALDAAAGVTGLAGLALTAAGWMATGTILILLCVLFLSAMRVRALHAFDEPRGAIDAWIADGVALAAMPALAIGVFSSGGPTSYILVIATLAALVLGRRALADRLHWAPSPVTVAGLLCLASLIGLPRLGIALVAGHAMAALAVAIERLRRQG